MRYPQFPTQEEWKTLQNNSPLQRFKACMKKLDEKNHTEKNKDIFELFDQIAIWEWTRQIAHRLDDIVHSYIMLNYYYNQGIPDDRGYISPGNNGESVQFFPDFEEKHFYIKDLFDYHTDIFYYKLFSAWDIVGQLLNCKYNLKIEKVYFHKAVNGLKSKNNSLYLQFHDIHQNETFKQANLIRNDIAHNHLPNTTDMWITKKENPTVKTITMGIRKYTTSFEIVNNIEASIDLFERTLIYLAT